MKKVKETVCAFIYVLIDSVRWTKNKIDFNMRTKKEAIHWNEKKVNFFLCKEIHEKKIFFTQTEILWLTKKNFFCEAHKSMWYIL